MSIYTLDYSVAVSAPISTKLGIAERNYVKILFDKFHQTW
jgi:hypothetical protein